jgi:prevent-host-death family protein
MKTIEANPGEPQLSDLLDSAQAGKVLVTRNGRPSAVIIGVEGYDEEDLSLAASPEFWKLIESRRTGGQSIPLSTLKQQLGLNTR